MPKMQIAHSKVDGNSFQSSNFNFVQLSPLKFKYIQFRLFVKFRWKFVVKCAINQWKKYFKKFSNKKSIKFFLLIL